MERKSKILILGSSGIGFSTDDVRVESFDWQHLSRIKNIKDYDTVILNVLGLRGLPRQELDKLDWSSFGSLFNLAVAHDITNNGGQVIVVGDPRFPIGRTIGSDPVGEPMYRNTPFLQWTGMLFRWDDAPGDTLEMVVASEEGSLFLDLLHRWDYSLVSVEENIDILGPFIGGMDRDTCFMPHLNPLCTNRCKYALAFTVYLEVFNGVDRMDDIGPFLFLPPIDASPDETLRLVLKEVCEVDVRPTEPVWLSKMEAPLEAGVNVEIQRITKEIQEQEERLRAAEARRANLRMCLKLLYEREGGLELVVRKILAELGAQVEVPGESKADGWVEVATPTQHLSGVLEIKSTKSKHFTEDGLRQTGDWVVRGAVERKKQYKGLFIGNSCVDTPVDDRPDPFSDSFKRTAKLLSVCAMTTADLYRIYELHCAGQVNLDMFWDMVFQTSGILDVPLIIRKSA